MFPHIVGNFPTHVFCEVIPKDSEAFKEAVLESAELCHIAIKNLQKEGYEENDFLKHVERTDNFHISLSRPFAIRRHQIDSLVKNLTKNLIRDHSSMKGPLDIVFEKCSVFGNNFEPEEQQESPSRLFDSLIATHNNGRILSLIQSVNETLIDFEIKPYYSNPIPHLSVSWIIPSSSLNKQLQLPLNVGNLKETVSATISRVCLKCGDQLYTLLRFALP